MNPSDERARRAREAGETEVGGYLSDPTPRVVLALLENPNIKEGHVLRIAGRRNIPAPVIEEIASRRDWMENKRIRLAVARNPRTPLQIALEQLKFLSLFDLVEITNDRAAQAILRRKVEAIVIERLPKQPLGMKKAVARKASGDVLVHLLERDQPDVIEICLDSPRLTEGHVYRLLHRETTAACAVRMIARHGKWTNQYNVRLALMLNPHTPLGTCVGFIPSLKVQDLKVLKGDSRVHTAVKIHIRDELARRKARLTRQR